VLKKSFLTTKYTKKAQRAQSYNHVIQSDSYVTLQNYGNKIINSFKLKPPFLFPPRGKGFFAPSPLGGRLGRG